MPTRERILSGRAGQRTALLAPEHEGGVLRSVRSLRVLAPVAIEHEVEPSACTELDHIDRLAAPGGVQEKRQQDPRALHLVRLHVLARDVLGEEILVPLERVVPRRLAGQYQAMKPAEQSERTAPLAVAHEDASSHGIVREPPAETRVQRGTPLAVEGLLFEDLLRAHHRLLGRRWRCGAVGHSIDNTGPESHAPSSGVGLRGA